MRCPKCKANNPNIAHYCHNCGQQLPQPGSYTSPLVVLGGIGLVILALGVVAVVGIFLLRPVTGPTAVVTTEPTTPATSTARIIVVTPTPLPATDTSTTIPPTDTSTPIPHIPVPTDTPLPLPTDTPIPPPMPTNTPPVVTSLTTMAQVRASDQAKDGLDNCGNTVVYYPSNLTDGQRETAWRVAGDGQGTWIQFDFGYQVMLTSVQILPGYSKRDPCDSSDWCPKNRIPQRVHLQATAGEQIELLLDNDCIWQAFDVGPWRTTSLRMTIMSSYPRREEHHTDNTTISEIQLLGWEF